MASTLLSVHERMVQEVADIYTRQGYYVQTEPSEDELPDFLKGFHPDLIVRLPDGGQVVVEVKSNGTVSGDERWQKLKDAVESHAGWQLKLVLNTRREQELVDTDQPLLTTEEIEARLLAGKRLAEQGLLDGNLLITWSALEAILRHMSQREKIKLSNQSPATLITQLVSEGPLDRDDYRVLMQILPARNQAAHGHQPENLDGALVAQVQAIANRLLKQQRRKYRSTRANRELTQVSS